MSARLILASSSKYRAQLLKRLTIPFEQYSPNIDESVYPDESPTSYVKRVSLTKTNAVSQSNSTAWVIGSDQAAVFDNQIIGKPLSHKNAVTQLAQFSGKTVKFITGVCLQNLSLNQTYYEESVTLVEFKSLSLKRINSYLRAERPYDCAGSFMVESKGIILFEKVTSDDPTSLEGLPMISLCRLFDRALELTQVDLLAPTFIN